MPIAVGITGVSTLTETATGNADALAQPLPNFYLEIAQDWPYRDAWIARAGLFGLSGVLNPTFFDSEAGIDESVAVLYTNTAIVGRPEGYTQYTGTGNRQLAITLQFRAQGQSSGNGYATTTRDWLIREVQDPVRWLDSLRYPYISDESGTPTSHGTPPIVLYFGELLTMRCNLTEAAIKWMPPFDRASLLPHGAEVPCTFEAASNGISNYAFRGPSRWAGNLGPSSSRTRSA